MDRSGSEDALAYHHGNLREALIERAIDAIEKNGVAAVSLRALARDIGVSHAAPTRHFPTRSALLAAIAQHGIASLLKSASEQVDNPQLTSVQKLKAMSKGYLAWVFANPVHHMLVRNQDVMRHAADDLVQQINTYARLHERTIVQAQQEGWRADENPQAVFLRLTALTAGLALTASDPIYATVFRGGAKEREIYAALAEFFD